MWRWPAKLGWKVRDATTVRVLPVPVTDELAALRVHWLLEMLLAEPGAAVPAMLLPSSAMRVNRPVPGAYLT